MSRQTRNQGNNPIYNSLKKEKNLGINLMKETKDLFNESYKPLKRETKETSEDGKISYARGLAESIL
jgi:hypothetical protein